MMRRILLAIAACAVAATAAYPQSSDRSTQPSDNVGRDKPAVNVQENSDAPLRLAVETKWATADQQMLEVYFTVTNVGVKPIRAYTVRVVGGTERQQNGGCFLNNAAKSGKILRQNQSAGRSTWRPVSSGSQEPIELMLDFIEFGDGSVWGGDSCRSAERLNGLRFGARLAKSKFKRKLDEKGVDALLRRLYSDDPELVAPDGHSETWKEGF